MVQSFGSNNYLRGVILKTDEAKTQNIFGICQMAAPT
jgi:hypothetical protein